MRASNTTCSSNALWRGGFLCVYVFGVCLMPLCGATRSAPDPEATPQSAPTQDCHLDSADRDALFPYLDQDQRNRVIRLRGRLCDLLRKEQNPASKSLLEAKLLMSAYVFREHLCTGNDVAQKWVAVKPPTRVSAYRKYCGDTFDGTQYMSVDFGRILKSTNWVMTEEFCQCTRYVAEPDSLILNVLAADSPSRKRLRDQSLALCDELRAGKLTYGEAQYRWDQELAWCTRQLTPELGQKVGESIKKLFEVLSARMLK